MINSLCKFSGSQSHRSIMALQNVGPAVLNGGVSTFLAMVLLAFSNSYVFTVFFKVTAISSIIVSNLHDRI